MMRLFFKTKIMLSLIFIAGVAFAANADKMADEGCKCLKAPYKKMEEMKPLIRQAMESRDMSKMTKLQDEMGQMMGSSQACFDKLDAKYPHVKNNQELEDKISRLMDQKCPRPDMGFQMQGQS